MWQKSPLSTFIIASSTTRDLIIRALDSLETRSEFEKPEHLHADIFFEIEKLSRVFGDVIFTGNITMSSKWYVLYKESKI